MDHIADHGLFTVNDNVNYKNTSNNNRSFKPLSTESRDEVP